MIEHEERVRAADQDTGLGDDDDGGLIRLVDLKQMRHGLGAAKSFAVYSNEVLRLAHMNQVIPGRTDLQLGKIRRAGDESKEGEEEGWEAEGEGSKRMEEDDEERELMEAMEEERLEEEREKASVAREIGMEVEHDCGSEGEEAGGCEDGECGVGEELSQAAPWYAGRPELEKEEEGGEEDVDMVGERDKTGVQVTEDAAQRAPIGILVLVSPSAADKVPKGKRRKSLATKASKNPEWQQPLALTASHEPGCVCAACELTRPPVLAKKSPAPDRRKKVARKVKEVRRWEVGNRCSVRRGDLWRPEMHTSKRDRERERASWEESESDAAGEPVNGLIVERAEGIRAAGDAHGMVGDTRERLWVCLTRMRKRRTRTTWQSRSPRSTKR